MAGPEERMERALARQIVESSYLTGSFTLRSGATSEHYFDKYQFESRPQLLRAIAVAMKALLPPGTEVLAGLELGGVPLAIALSLETGLPAAFVRKQRKAYGTQRIAEGAPVRGRNVCIIEDVITTGGQVIASAKDLKSDGAIIAAVCCVIYRGQAPCQPLAAESLDLRQLFTMDELMGSKPGIHA